MGSFFFSLSYSFVVLVELPFFYYCYGALMVIWVILSYYLLGDVMSKIFYLVGIGLCLPMISHPLHMLPAGIDGLIIDAVMASDRIQVREIALSFLGLLLLVDVCHFLLVRRSPIILIVFLPVCLLLLIALNKSYQTLSLMQVLIDLGTFFGCIAAIAYFREKDFDEALNVKAWSLFNTVFFFLCVVVCLDIAVTLSNLVPWTTSFRGGLQGVFYGMETPFAFVVGLALTYALSYCRLFSILFVILLVFGGAVLLESNVKTAVVGVVLAAIFLRAFGFGFIKRLTLPVALICIALLTFITLNVEEATSLAVRATTLMAYFVQLGNDFQWVFGIAPGVTSYVMSTNLAEYFFSLDYTASIIGLPDAFIGELMVREDYTEGGAFLPHNSPFALVASYGVLMLLPSIYYFITAPYQLLKTYDRSSTFSFTLTSVTLYMAVFMHFHPFFILLPLIVFTELIVRHSSSLESKSILEKISSS